MTVENTPMSPARRHTGWSAVVASGKGRAVLWALGGFVLAAVLIPVCSSAILTRLAARQASAAQELARRAAPARAPELVIAAEAARASADLVAAIVAARERGDLLPALLEQIVDEPSAFGTTDEPLRRALEAFNRENADLIVLLTSSLDDGWPRVPCYSAGGMVRIVKPEYRRAHMLVEFVRLASRAPSEEARRLVWARRLAKLSAAYADVNDLEAFAYGAAAPLPPAKLLVEQALAKTEVSQESLEETRMAIGRARGLLSPEVALERSIFRIWAAMEDTNGDQGWPRGSSPPSQGGSGALLRVEQALRTLRMAEAVSQLSRAREVVRLPVQERYIWAMESEIDETDFAKKRAPGSLSAAVRMFLDVVLETDFEARVAAALCETGCAVEHFREAQGKWPDALPQLVPHYLAELPLDAATGRGLEYGRWSKGVVVYSAAAIGSSADWP